MLPAKGQIHVYTGYGKGKTTAALGLAIRAIGYGKKVGIIYFDKGGDYYNERKILDCLKDKNIYYKAFGQTRVGKIFRFENTKEDLKEAKKGLKQAQEWLQEDFDVLILDEINTTAKTKLLKLKDIISLIKKKPDKLELILTGRYCPNEIIDLADLVREMQETKHYINKGLAARPGIDY